jgi:hypothetical protein
MTCGLVSDLRAVPKIRRARRAANAQFLRHPEDARTRIVFRNPTLVDEFVLKFQKPI